MSKTVTTQSFIEKAKKIHGDKYDYSKVKYINNTTKVTIICKEHGEFSQRPSGHLQGAGCPTCGGTKKINFLERSRQIHGDKYIYNNIGYVKRFSKIKIICKEHGEFVQTASTHLKGAGCQVCAGNKKITTQSFIEKAKKIHGDKYDYSKVEYKNADIKVTIICKEHGEFQQLSQSHLKGHSCHKCSIKSATFSIHKFIEKAKKIHGDKYDYSKVAYVHSKSKVLIICKEHGEFLQEPNEHWQGQGCPLCKTIISKPQQQIIDFLNEFKMNYTTNDRKQLEGKELDVYFPSINKAIEIHGLYYHTVKFIDGKYHKEKYDLCKKKGIELFQIYDSEIRENFSLIKSMIRNFLGLNNQTIYARKCIIKEITKSEYTSFLNENHIQGSRNDSIILGLLYENELISVIGFSKIKEGLSLNRFCSKQDLRVVGGFSKLLKYVKEQFNLPIITFSDNRYSFKGNLYEKNGFKIIKELKPDYQYTNGLEIKHKFSFRVKAGINEVEEASKKSFYKIYGSGKIKWIFY